MIQTHIKHENGQARTRSAFSRTMCLLVNKNLLFKRSWKKILHGNAVLACLRWIRFSPFFVGSGMLSRSSVDRVPIKRVQWSIQAASPRSLFVREEGPRRGAMHQRVWKYVRSRGRCWSVKENVTDLGVMNKRGLYSTRPGHSSYCLIMEPKNMYDLPLPLLS